MTKTLTLAECKSIVNRLLDAAKPYAKGKKFFELIAISMELTACDDFDNLACILEDAMDSIPKQKINADWWPDELVDAWKQAEQLKQIL